MSDVFRLHLFESNLLPWILMLAMLLMVEAGWRIGQFALTRYQATKVEADDTFMAAIFGLLALLIALTFSGASDRFDKRRDLIVKEITTFGTAYQSVDLLTAGDQPEVRELFKRYLDNRMVVYQRPFSETVLAERLQKQAEIGAALWKSVVKAVGNTAFPQQLVAAQLLPEVSDMFDASDNQRLAMKFHPPHLIWQSLIALALIGSLVAGYNMGIQRKRDWILTGVFVLLMAGTIFVILNLEFPRVGIVNLDDFEQEIAALRKTL